MGFRFQRRIRVFKGFNINLSKSGIGFSLGPRGAKMGVNSKGQPYGSVGIPGTGLSYRTVLGKKQGIDDPQPGQCAQPVTQQMQSARPPSKPADQTTVTAYVIGLGIAIVIVGIIAVLSASMSPSSHGQRPLAADQPAAPVQQPEPLRVYTVEPGNRNQPASEGSAPSPGGAGARSADPDNGPKDVNVHGYYRKNGTYVSGHHRRSARY